MVMRPQGPGILQGVLREEGRVLVDLNIIT